MTKYEALQELITKIPVTSVKTVCLKFLEKGELHHLQIYLSGFAFGFQINGENELLLHPIHEILNLLKR